MLIGFNVAKILVLDTAPGVALKNMLKTWQKIPDTHVVVNTSTLPSDDKTWLSQQSSVSQINFDPLNESELIKHIKNAGGYPIITTRLNVPFKKDLLQELASKNYANPLTIIGQAGSTTSHIDIATATQCNIAVTHTPGANANAVAEYVIAQILNLLRGTSIYNQSCHAGTWSKYLIPPVGELSEKTIGLIGFGHIAKAVTFKAKALGMPVMAYSRSHKNFEGVTFTSELKTLLTSADFISVHVPFTAETKNLISKNEISLMKNGSFIINTSRGGIVNEDDIAVELKNPNSKLAGVAFDVFEQEGEKFASPLIGCKNAILTPHIAGTTNAALSNTATQLVENIISILSGNNPVLANPEVLKKNDEQP
jgi:D-3-phosphoglycerate dehydrogenase